MTTSDDGLARVERDTLARAFHDIYCTQPDEEDHPLDQEDYDWADDLAPIVAELIEARVRRFRLAWQSAHRGRAEARYDADVWRRLAGNKPKGGDDE